MAKRILTKFKKNLIAMDYKKYIYKLSHKNSIQMASDLLKSGKVIALPTDTIYGLACSANDPIAIQNLYKIKAREEGKPVAICVGDYDDILYWSKAQHLPRLLLKELLPGPVTIVMYKSEHLNNPFLNPGWKKIGIRIPDFNFIRDISRSFNYPIALTSANKSSVKSSLNINEFSELWPQLSAIFDGGTIGLSDKQRAGSTVIDLSVEGYYEVIRKGCALNETLDLMKKYNISCVTKFEYS